MTMNNLENKHGVAKVLAIIIAFFTILITVWAIRLAFCALAAVVILSLIDFICGTMFFTATYVAGLAVILFIIGTVTK